VLEVEAIVAEKSYAGSRAKQQNFLRIIYSLPIFSLGCIKTLWVMAPSVVSFCSEFIVDETSIIYVVIC